MPLKLCKWPRCPNEAVPDVAYCAGHQRHIRKHYERFYTKGTAAPGITYGRPWKREKTKHLVDHPFCHCGGPRRLFCPGCNAPIQSCGKTATDVDHKVPHRNDPLLFWDRTNWQSLAHDCHARKTAREVFAQ